MGQESKWHHQQLNQYSSDLRNSIQNAYNYNLISSYNKSKNEIVDGFEVIANNFNNNANISSIQTSLLNENTFGKSLTLNFSSPLFERLSNLIHSPLTADSSLSNNASNGDYNDNESILSDYWMWLLIVLYVIVILGGIFGNASLIITLYTQSSARLRNPLLVALCLADLMVTGISAPLTVVTLIFATQHSLSSTTFICRLIYFMQVSIIY